MKIKYKPSQARQKPKANVELNRSSYAVVLELGINSDRSGLGNDTTSIRILLSINYLIKEIFLLLNLHTSQVGHIGKYIWDWARSERFVPPPLLFVSMHVCLFVCLHVSLHVCLYILNGYSLIGEAYTFVCNITLSIYRKLT